MGIPFRAKPNVSMLNGFLTGTIDRIIEDPTPLPPPAATPETDAELFANEPWILAPIHTDYGCNVRLGAGVFLNFNSTFVDTCLITIGARTLVG